jgi:hypothetical protein
MKGSNNLWRSRSRCSSVCQEGKERRGDLLKWVQKADGSSDLKEITREREHHHDGILHNG